MTFVLGVILIVFGMAVYASNWTRWYSNRDHEMSALNNVIVIATIGPSYLVELELLPKILRVRWLELFFVFSILAIYYYIVSCFIVKIWKIINNNIKSER